MSIEKYHNYEKVHAEIIGFVTKTAPGVKVVTDIIERGFMIWLDFGHGVTKQYYVPLNGEWGKDNLRPIINDCLRIVGKRIVAKQSETKGF